MIVKTSGEMVETAREMRGAEPGPSVRNVLSVSTTFVVIAFAAIEFAYFT